MKQEKSLQANSRYLFLNGLALKIIALLLMTVDHIGLFFFSGTTGDVLRSIGRLALPLFIFLSVESVYHSKKPYRYSLVLIGLGFLMDIGLFCYYHFMTDSMFVGNVFTLLGLGSLACTLIKRYDKLSFLAILPITYAVCSSFTAIFRPFINCEYGLYGISLYLVFFACYELVPKIMRRTAEKSQMDYDIVCHFYERKYKNYYCLLALVLHTAVFYLLYRINYTLPIIPFSFNVQQWAMFAGVFFIFYSGKRGYSNALLKYSFYIYYPAHIAVLALIAALLINA